MTRMIRIAAAAGLLLALGASDGADARPARGAFIYQTNNPDPTVAPHPHRMKTRTYRLTDTQVELSRCKDCGFVRETETSTTDSTAPVLRLYYPLR